MDLCVFTAFGDLEESITCLFSIAKSNRGSNPCRGCAGLNRHVVGDERALQERSSESILTLSLAIAAARWCRSVDKGIGGPGD